MPNLISAQHMRPVRELLKKWLSSLDFFAVHCCKVVTITLSCIFQRLKYWFYPFTYLYFSHKEWRKDFPRTRETFLWENISNSTTVWLLNFYCQHQLDFWPKLNILQENCCILWRDLMPGSQNVPKLDFQDNFLQKESFECF